MSQKSSSPGPSHQTTPRLISRDPYSETILETFEASTDDQLEQALVRAEHAFSHTRRLPLVTRRERLLRLGERLDAHRDELAEIATREMGKTFTAARSEVQKCALTARWYADHLEHLLADTPVREQPHRQLVRHLPLGPVLAIMPWNFPYWQAFRAAIPALSVGNVMLLKHASNVSRCALWIERLFTEAGFEEGEFQTLLLESARVGRLIADPRVRGVTLTGSEAAGRAVAAEAGRHLKKCVLELGGSDPFLVMPSADLEATAKAATTARTINNGQSCIAAKRFIVHEDVFDRFLSAFTTRMEAVRVGDPMDAANEMGPLVHAEAVSTLLSQIERAIDAGATPILRPAENGTSGNLIRPTILVAPDNPSAQSAEIFGEEMFGPVAMVYRARSLDQAIAIANHSRYGLGSSIWTSDENDIRRANEELEAGMTFVNAVVASEPQLPFGGIKDSGYGRELGAAGLYEFTNAKSLSLAPNAQSPKNISAGTCPEIAGD